MNDHQGTKGVVAKQPGGHGALDGVQHEVDIGTYEVYQGGILVGELLIEEDPLHLNNSNYRIEHWGLTTRYTMPSSTNTTISLELRYVRFEYGGSSADFRAHLRTITGLRYIQAHCVESAP